MDDRLDISVVVCTAGDTRTLAETIASIGRARGVTSLRSELIIVDNSHDGVAGFLISQGAGDDTTFRYLHDPRRGKGYAYNTGIMESRGAVLLFTDDDVLLPPTWIEKMGGPILSRECDAVAGGVVLPRTHELALRSTGSWPLRAWFAVTDSHSSGLVGANMAIARRVFEEIGGFDTVLGPGALGFGDETELMLRMLRAGFRVRGLPTCIAEHHFDLGRLQWEQLKSTAYRIGNTRGYLAWHHDGKRLGIVRPWATRILPRLFLLPLLLPFWREGRARWLHLLSDIAAIRRNRIECRGPRRQLGERLAL